MGQTKFMIAIVCKWRPSSIAIQMAHDADAASENQAIKTNHVILKQGGYGLTARTPTGQPNFVPTIRSRRGRVRPLR